MKYIYLLSVDECDYDEFDSFVIIARNKEEAIRIAVKKTTYWDDEGSNWTNQEIKVQRLGVSTLKIGIQCASFNAG